MMTSMLFPMAALAFLTLIVMVLLVKVRFAAIKSGETKDLGYFETFKGESPEPAKVEQVRRNYYNLTTSPILFYAAGAAALGAGISDAILMYMAWGYVASRVIHTFIHITSNAVMMRFRIFLLGVVLITAIWVRIVMLAM